MLEIVLLEILVRLFVVEIARGVLMKKLMIAGVLLATIAIPTAVASRNGFEKFESCYPATMRQPKKIQHISYGGVDYFLAWSNYKKNSPESGLSRMAFKFDKGQCTYLNIAQVDPLAREMPMPVAARFKESQWQETIKAIGKAKLIELLDTPYEFPYGFFLFREDALALQKFGFKPSPRVSVIDDLTELDKYNPILQDRRRRQQQ